MFQKEETAVPIKKGGKFRRRAFLSLATALAGGGLLAWVFGPWRHKISPVLPVSIRKSPANRKKLIFIAIDALHPKYLDLDANGLSGGREGDWLMPNIRGFL